MEDLATKTISTIKGNGPIDTKLAQLADLKAEVKHRHCPEPAITPLFDVVRASIATPHLSDAGFSILGHLMKRLELQNQNAHLQAQGTKTYPRLLERLSDPKDRTRHRAIQALADFHSVCANDVEQFVRDNVLTSRNPKAREAGMEWITKIRKEKNMQFKTFVPNIVNCLEDADGSVRRTAQATIIELFQNAGAKGMNDLQKHLQQRNVRKAIAAHITSELGLDTSADVETTGSLPTPRQIPNNASVISDISADAPPMSVSEQEAAQLEPSYIATPRDLEEIFREMHPHFEGKESEQNWLRREKSVLKLRQINKGNAPQDFATVYLAGIKSLLDGILKTVNSLRTTVSTIGCHLVQDIARVAGPGIDSMVEILLQNLIKLCANTKKITAAKGNDTVIAVMANVSYSARLIQHIHIACQDKNVQPRSYASGWLKILIDKHQHHKSTMEHGGALELIDKCIRLALSDRDPTVRASMRPTYYAYARIWPSRSEVIMSNLDRKQQDLLINDPANPNAGQALIPSAAATTSNKSSFSQSTSSVPTRPSIKDTIAAQKKAKATGKTQFVRPGSAQSFASPTKSTTHSIARPATAMSGSLSSAPVRPRRIKIPSKQNNERDVTENIPPNTSNTLSEYKAYLASLHDNNSNEREVTENLVEGTVDKREDENNEGEQPQRISPTPGPVNGMKERKRRSLQVYEDPEEAAVQTPGQYGYPLSRDRDHTPIPLGELPVNEPVRSGLDTQTSREAKERGRSPDSHKKWLALEATENKHFSPSPSLNKSDPRLAKKILQKCIDQVDSRALDVHGFRKLQSLIRTAGDSIWEDGLLFDELLTPLLNYLEIPNDELYPPSGSKAQDIKTQVLVTVRLMLQHQPKLASPNYPRALGTVIAARKYCYPTSHIVSGLDETAERIVYNCDPEKCIDSVLELLENEGTEGAEAETNTISAGLHVLADLLRRARSGKSTTFLLPGEQEERMGRIGTRCLADTEPEIRRAVMEMLLELHDSVAEEGFWGLLFEAKEDHRALITYYIVRRRAGRD